MSKVCLGVLTIAVCAALGCPSSAAPTAAYVTAPPASDYHLPVWPQPAVSPVFSLTDFDGRRRTLHDYLGRVVVVFFGYAHCPDVCPAELVKLSLVMKRLGPAGRHVQVLFVTLDPQRDTAPILKRYVTAFDPHFIGLTGTSREIDRAAASFLVQFAKVPTDGDYAMSHTSNLLVLDRAGHLRLAGTSQSSVDDLAHDMAKLAAE